MKIEHVYTKKEFRLSQPDSAPRFVMNIIYRYIVYLALQHLYWLIVRIVLLYLKQSKFLTIFSVIIFTFSVKGENVERK